MQHSTSYSCFFHFVSRNRFTKFLPLHNFSWVGQLKVFKLIMLSSCAKNYGYHSPTTGCFYCLQTNPYFLKVSSLLFRDERNVRCYDWRSLLTAVEQMSCFIFIARLRCLSDNLQFVYLFIQLSQLMMINAQCGHNAAYSIESNKHRIRMGQRQ